MATRKKRPRRKKRVRRPASRGPLERSFARAIMTRVAEPLRKMTRKRLRADLPRILRDVVRTDAGDVLRLDVDELALARTIEGLRIQFGRAVPLEEIEAIATEALGRTQAQQGRQLELQLGPEGARLRREILGLDPLGSEPWLRQLLEQATEDNVALIKSIPENYFADIQATVLEQGRAGARVEALSLELENKYLAHAAAWVKSTENRAKLIAVDQVGKLYGELDRLRQTDIGIKRYRWRSSRDERVRGNPSGKFPRSKPSHWAREGRIYEWDDPPSESRDDGHPGKPIRCRCYAEPVFER